MSDTGDGAANNDTGNKDAENKTVKPLPIWAKIGRIVAVVGAAVLIVVAILQSNATGEEREMWERVGNWVFNAMVVGVVALFVGRFQSRR
ncbi:MAG TPA: hypothetical protein PKE40_13145 [Arachnia sp.]|nr:hypothetical protein [Arachnia sp.]HMT87291.1 hypothetical protein [Arachnia sp.]